MELVKKVGECVALCSPALLVCFSKSLRRREMEGRRCTGRIISSDQRIFITDNYYSLEMVVDMLRGLCCVSKH
jgi:hypothetical protein